MTKLYYRGMAEKDGKPKIGRSARLLDISGKEKDPSPNLSPTGGEA
ncbi:hypothetical protein [Calothrix sp. CCY 0018]